MWGWPSYSRAVVSTALGCLEPRAGRGNNCELRKHIPGEAVHIPLSYYGERVVTPSNPFSPVKARGRRGAAFCCGGNRQIVERLSQPLLGASRPVSGRRGIGKRELRMRNQPFKAWLPPARWLIMENWSSPLQARLPLARWRERGVGGEGGRSI